ncbi:MAG: ergothioneine biosynthesis protein EgtB [Planctomycetales bacterium]|nr:ergothioneine biosynthesis protein EgtB [Planctomycetales bacterium]
MAHTSWFFEQFLLVPHLPGYQRFHDGYGLLFNSYYQGVGRAFTRAQRGLLSRPTVADVMRYRAHVDSAMVTLLNDPRRAAESTMLTELGCHHEQQHQELMLTDIKHVLSCNPLYPVFAARQDVPNATKAATPLSWTDHAQGVYEIGDATPGFAFDNERPRHRVLVERYGIARRLTTNGEIMEFIADGGYRRPEHWLSAGWATVQEQGWEAPLYWLERDGIWMQFTLSGLRPVETDEPVCHVSYYEADAYARWQGHRLPTEAEWEIIAVDSDDDRTAMAQGNFADSGHYHPLAASPSALSQRPKQLFGDVWEWTSSSYAAYPGYRPADGALGEYNGKFMCNQYVLRGGSCATPAGHVRATYRNFFPPDARWQFSGIRLARDV